jgi:large subunit ribosomal protein L29
MAETRKLLFRMRIQAQTERLDVPTEMRRNRRQIARIKTILREREIAQAKASSEAAAG